jgi:hypothetical protein
MPESSPPYASAKIKRPSHGVMGRFRNFWIRAAKVPQRDPTTAA